MAGTWIGASYVLGRDVSVDEPYPHICGHIVAGRVTRGLTVGLKARECAACAERRQPARPDGAR